MTISTCPKCDGRVTLPHAAPSSARVKCPLCQEEYLLGEALEKLPPALILLDVPLAVDAEGVTAADAELAMAASESDVFNVDSLLPVAAGGRSNGEIDDDELSFHPAGEAGDDLELDDAAISPFAPSYGIHAGLGGTAVAVESDKATVAAKPRRKMKKKHPFRQMIEVMVGGLMAIPITLMILFWGFHADPLNLKPKIPTWMSWAVPAEFRPSSPPIGAGGKPADGANGERANANGDNGDENGDKANDGNPNADAGNMPSDDAPKRSTDDGGGKLGNVDRGTDKTADGNAGKTDAKRPTDDPFEKLSKPADDKPTTLPDTTTPPKVDQPAADKTKDAKSADEKSTVEKPADEKPADQKPTTPAAALNSLQPYTAEQLNAAFDAALDAKAAFAPQDAEAKKAFTREKYAAYGKLCDVAHARARADVKDADARQQLSQRAAAVDDMARTLASDDDQARVIGQCANAWLARTRTSDGIVLTGVVGDVGRAGRAATISVVLPALEDKLKPQTVIVVCDVAPALKALDRVVVVGTVVEKPTADIAGYEGQDTRVVWGASVSKLSAADVGKD